MFKHLNRTYETDLYPANERGTNDIGCLKANFSFSLVLITIRDKIQFGALRILNDDIIAGGRGSAVIRMIIWRS